MSDYAIILAGGKGLRMGADVPKQFLPVGGLPILMRTIRRFREYSSRLHIILVLPLEQQEYWRELCEKYHFDEKYDVTTGGETRFHSIVNGLKLIPDDADGVVSVHDGVRPFPSVEVIGQCYKTARRTGTAVPVVPVVETVRHLSDAASPDAMSHSETVPRDEYRLVQTPQAFDIQLHKKAYRQPFSKAFTDDASVVEAMGHAITLVEGNRENIKITTPFDIIVAEAIVNH
ncbi:MAG: 2-C-methyl-D-erythritol 4-phosphate cytidylyltransferase [Prevotella sp.]|nr:2-C-methyl-D-erythritol 4-phosphate cytidylyltransferase [Prevotella sp.]